MRHKNRGIAVIGFNNAASLRCGGDCNGDGFTRILQQRSVAQSHPDKPVLAKLHAGLVKVLNLPGARRRLDEQSVGAQASGAAQSH